MAKNELEYTHFGTSGLFEGKYSDIRDDSPEEVVRKIHPKSQGLTLQRERTGLSLLRLDLTAVLDPRPHLLCAMSSSPLAYR